jgi:hypothetical protein
MKRRVWIAESIIFEQGSGKKTVLMSVNNIEAATVFDEATGQNRLSSFQSNTPEIEWFLEHTPKGHTPKSFVVCGVWDNLIPRLTFAHK